MGELLDGQTDNSLVVHFGKIGSDGHRQAQTAQRLAAKLIADKTKKGYRAC